MKKHPASPFALLVLLIAGCQQKSQEASDIGSNPPPVEFQAACLTLPRGAVVSLTQQPTLGVVLRTMSVKDHMNIRWEQVSNQSYIQWVEGADPLTSKELKIGTMFTMQPSEPTQQCPNGFVLLDRMVVNGEEVPKAGMNDLFVSFVDVGALNAAQPTANAPIAAAPPPPPAPSFSTTDSEQVGPPSDLDYCVQAAPNEATKVNCYDDEIDMTIQMARTGGTASEAEIEALTANMDRQCAADGGILQQRQCQQRLAQDFNISLLDRQGR